MKLREGDPWMPAKEYSKTLSGISINLLVMDIDDALFFQGEVLGVEVVYSDPDFAVVRACGGEWMLHADHSYDKHPMGATVSGVVTRGNGVEIRLHGLDPDAAESAAREMGCEIISPATDKGHGVREAHIRDQDGYIWVPDVLLEGGEQD